MSVICAAAPAAAASDPAGAPLLASPHLVPRVKRVIYLFQSGGPSQLELFDYKPRLRSLNGEELPASIRMGQRLTGMTAHQKSFPMAGSQFEFTGGTLTKVVFDIADDAYIDVEAHLAAAMARD